MPKIKISKKQAREFLLERQYLIGPKLPAGEKSVEKVLDRLKAVQVDSITVAGTNQEIAFNSRISKFLPRYLDEALYEKQKAFEYWLKCLCIITMAHRPYYENCMKELEEFHKPNFEKHQDVVSQVLKAISDNGPMCSSDFKDPRRVAGWWGPSESLVKAILNGLWDSGLIMIHHRKGRVRYFDLSNRIAPPSKVKPDYQEYQKRSTLDILSAMRMFSLKGSYSEIWYGTRKFRNSIRSEMLDEGAIVPVDIEGCSRPYGILKEDIKYIGKKVKTDNTVRLLAPLDSVSWDRRLVKDIFNFDCLFEVYKPPAQRKYGYYSLPVLFKTDMVGRCDLAKDRKKKSMLVHSIHWEPHLEVNSELLESYAESLKDHARFLEMDNVLLPSSRYKGSAELKKLF